MGVEEEEEEEEEEEGGPRGEGGPTCLSFTCFPLDKIMGLRFPPFFLLSRSLSLSS